MSNEMPENLFTWVLAGVGAVVGTLATTVAALFKISESKNAKAIEEQRRESAEQKLEFAAVRAQMATEISQVRKNLEVTEEARIECERDRASLKTKCEIFEARIQRLEERKQ
jgi:septal ring factor EnvC (AmiA/AmiB activator)